MSQTRHVLDDYRLDRVVRSGSRTTVFRALDPTTSRRVVIKLVYPPAEIVPESNRAAFLYAAEVARSGLLRGLPRVVDYGLTPDDQAFLVMDMAEIAVPLGELSSVSGTRRLAIAAHLVEAVDALAVAGIAHLNLRPDNLLVAPSDTPVLTGFGTAAYLAGAGTGVWPEAGDPWTAPELVRPGILDSGELWRADLYSLARLVGAVLGGAIRQAGEEAEVGLPDGIVSDRKGLEAALAAALHRDPLARSTTLSSLRQLLVPAVSDDPFHLDDEFATREITTPLQLEPPPSAPARPPATTPPQAAGARPPTPPVRAESPSPRSHPQPSPPPRPPSPSPPPPRPTAPSEQAPKATAEPDDGHRGPRWDLIAPIAAALLVIAVAAAVVIGRSGAPPRSNAVIVEAATPAPTARAAPSPAPTVTVIHPNLQVADRLVAGEDMAGARELLEALDDDVVGGFNDAESALYDELMAASGATDRARALSDLDGGLEHGSVPMLRRAVPGLAGLGRDELAADPELGRKLARARRALAAHDELRAAERQGDPLVIIDRADAMIEVLPGYSRSYTLREEAAAAVEARAEAAIARRELEDALATLRGLEQRWPDRPGLADRIAWCGRQLRSDAEMEAVLDRAREAGRGGDPERGLALLAAATPSETFVIRFEELRIRLAAQLAEMDSLPPTIDLPADFDPVLRKNETIVVPLQIRDDYRVERATAWVAAEPGEAYREVVLADGGSGVYPLTLDPETHGNSRVLFYVVASDRSGHESRLGSAEQPLSLERRSWLKRLTGGGG